MRAVLAAAVLLLSSVPALEARQIGETEIVSERALARLKANKGLTLQWLWGAKPGALTVTETPQGVRLKGGQGPDEGKTLSLEGVVIRLEEKSFTFRGRVEIFEPEAGVPCIRDGMLTFRITGQRKFWRMKEQIAGCPGRADLTDYVDIRF
jgi:hypothetical protein